MIFQVIALHTTVARGYSLVSLTSQAVCWSPSRRFFFVNNIVDFTS